jgi:hypothetical protein
MTTIKNISNITNDKIQALWVMGGASAMKDYYTKEVDHYLCYCDACKEKSVSKEGGIAFKTAEELLLHRKMKAFQCPCGCGFHVCEERGSIVRHLTAFHPEVLAKLESDGLDRKKSWIYPDNSNNSYTLTKPMPILEGSPLENAGIILSITPPKRVEIAPTTVTAFKKKKFVPIEQGLKAQSEGASAELKDESKADPKAEPKKWAKVERQEVSLSKVMEEEQELQSVEHKKATQHYAQDDMRKEQQCPYGKGCVKKDRPFACALNHDEKGDVIKRGTLLTDDILCAFERPPFMRCGDGRCTKIHLEHRARFIEEKKSKFFDPSQQSYSDAVGSPKAKRDATAVITTSEHGTILTMSKEDALAVANALQELDNSHDSEQEDSEWDGPRKAFGDESPKMAAKEESEDEDDDDLTDLTTFVKRCNKTTRTLTL